MAFDKHINKHTAVPLKIDELSITIGITLTSR